MPLPAHFSAAEAAAVGEFMAAAREVLGANLEAARLFGSRARGEGHEHSDLDIALIVTADGRARRARIYDLAFDIGLKHGVELAPLVVERARFRELEARERLIARGIAEEGLPL
jgi:predicted nucleotidyltransferase